MEMTHVLTTPSMIRLPSFAAAELEAYVKASNTGFFDDFGRAVALSGDTLVVGVPLQGADGDSLVDSGAVYVFRKTDGGWSQEAYLKASNAERDDSFGCAVALSGDTLVVGASGEATGIDSSHPSDLSADDSGAVYVYERTDGMWSQKAYLKASNAEKGDRFGSAVALSGDTLTVAAYLESSNATGINGDQSNNSAEGSGAVYVFERTDGMWSQKAYIKASNTGGGDQFGDAMALSGDTLVVGAFFEDSSATGINGDQLNDDAPDSGAVYVFRRTDGGWMQEAYLKASNTGEGDLFGGAVALSGNTLVVGAAGEDSSATGINGDQSNDGASSSGAVYVFERTNGGITGCVTLEGRRFCDGPRSFLLI
ncbi:MAG: hypothetical protein E8D40_10365 [Nitrospira sp.]|nr:MAG: hypothetical protein E8D40_10365 [Nitrospira sp.]